MTDKEFFSSLNLQPENLLPVKSSLEQGDTLGARQQLHEYYLNRTGMQYFSLSTGGNIDQANDNLNNFFTEVTIRLYAGNENGSVDWTMAYSGDSEWHWQFHRMTWLINLARVYQRTADEKYAQAWVSHLTDWATNNSPGYPRTLDTGNRLRNWVESYQYMVHLLKTSSLQADDHMIILKSFMMQARFLRDNWKQDSNWGASETRGLNEVLVMFPEFIFYPDDNREDWISLVQDRLLYHLSENFLDDGVQFETSPMYHYLTYRNLLIAYQLMSINNIAAPSAFDSLFIRPAEYIMHITKPDGYIPQLADSDREDRQLHYLGIAAEVFNRDDFRYVASRSSRGTPPTESFKAFPQGKNIIMRSGWGHSVASFSQEKYLVFNYSSNLPWHAHFDQLSIDAYAFGKNIVVDPGRYTYATDEGWRQYFRNTSAHNTVVVNENNQTAYSEADAWWLSLPGLDYIDAFHDAYTLRQQEVRHRRKVAFINKEYWVIADAITGKGTHKLDLYFNLDQDVSDNLTLNDTDHALRTPEFSILPSNPTADAYLETGWISRTYGSKTQAPVLKYSKTHALPVTFETILLPHQSPQPNTKVETVPTSGLNGAMLPADKAVAMNIQTPDWTDIVGFNHASPEPLIAGDITYSGAFFYIRNSNAANIALYGMVEGTYLAKHEQLLFESNGAPFSISHSDKVLIATGSDIDGFRAFAPGLEQLIINNQEQAFSMDHDYVYFGNMTTGIAESPEQQDTLPNIGQNYPNPFHTSTNIDICLTGESNVVITLLSLSGKQLYTIFEGWLPPGIHTVEFFNTHMKPGLYLYRMESCCNVNVKKMIIK